MRVEFLKSIVSLSVSLCFCLAVAIDVSACPVCIGFPSKTDADYLLDGCCVILARPQEQNPFQYAAQHMLKGVYDGSDFDLLVDSATRRLLEVHRDRSVLLIQETPQGSWQNLGTVSPEFEVVVRRLITAAAGWTGTDAAIHRWQFFIPLFGHTDERIRNLAYLEIGRAPYSAIRLMGRTISRDKLAPFLDNRRYMEWQGPAILLLAQSPSGLDQQRILNSFQESIELGLVTNLSAWTAAAIEVDPFASMDRIDAEYFSRDDRSPEEISAIILAVSMHGSLGDLKLRDRITDSYGLMLKHAPRFAPQVANDLYAWKRTEQTEILAAILNQPHEFDFNEIVTIRRYLRRAAWAEATGRGDDSK